MDSAPSYCIIGAGPAGLCTARHALLQVADASQVTVFEQTDQIGGLWVYNDSIGTDRNGLNVYSCLYANLRTNLVKQGMGYPDYPLDEQAKTFSTIPDVIHQLNGYTEKFGLRRVIKFEHQVLRVTRNFAHNNWDVLVKDLPRGQYETHSFDYVLVCNGHYSSPVVPEFRGRDEFTGRQLHSREYRRSEHYRDQRVLVVGGGHSGLDIAPEIAENARRVVLSHRCPHAAHTGSRVVQKPEVRLLTATGAVFVDGEKEDFDVIIYCTGYRYSVPFLSADCGVSVQNNCISPLYYHCININQPTMAFIGLPYNACLMLMMDLQARFCLKFYSGQMNLPSREKMLRVWQEDKREREERKLTGKLTHMLAGDLQQKYYDDLARIAELEPLKPVLAKMHAECISSKLEDVNFRNYEYRIIDDHNFIKIPSSGDDGTAYIAARDRVVM